MQLELTLAPVEVVEADYQIVLAPDWIYDLQYGDEIAGYTGSGQDTRRTQGERIDPDTIVVYDGQEPVLWRTYLNTGKGSGDGFELVYSGYDKKMALDVLWQRRQETQHATP